MTKAPAHPHPEAATPETLYASPPPWDIGRPQATFAALAESGAIKGRVLDAGCGTGEHALMAAGLGLEATGVDLAVTALRTAERKARERGLTVRFLRHDARDLADLGETFDSVLDSGLFHVFGGDDRTAYVQSLHQAIRPGGRYFMLSISDRQPGDWPHRLSQKDIREAFSDGWRLDSLEPATIEITTDPAGIAAWLVAATRI
jgi:cyclopropane fatty-acyl-phospholipid synthase-like methyltransferase